jgi:hypothetical protein
MIWFLSRAGTACQATVIEALLQAIDCLSYGAGVFSPGANVLLQYTGAVQAWHSTRRHHECHQCLPYGAGVFSPAANVLLLLVGVVGACRHP